jgi:hypothetical protein
MDPRLYEKALEMLGDGATYPILYNDDVNIPAVRRAFQVDEQTASRYLPFGCGEYILYGQSFGTPSGAINLLHCLNEMIASGELKRHEDFVASTGVSCRSGANHRAARVSGKAGVRRVRGGSAVSIFYDAV